MQEDVVVVMEGDDGHILNPKIAASLPLRRQSFVGGGDDGRRLTKEARQIYYSENIFNVPLHWLHEFMIDVESDFATPFAIAHLVRHIIIRADLHDGWHRYWSHEGADLSDDDDVDEGEAWERLASWTSEQLRNLLRFTGADHIEIQLWGGGCVDGQDEATQQTIQDTKTVGKELISQFGSRLALCKVLEDSGARSENLVRHWL